MAPSVRVVLATYEQPAPLGLALRGYLRQTTRDFALTVADDGSGAATRAVVESFAREAARQDIRVDHVWIEDRGFRKTLVLNESVRRSVGEPLLLFSDGDCIPPARFVERHRALHEPWSFTVGGAVRWSRERSASVDERVVDEGLFEAWITAADRRDLAKRARKSRWGTRLRLRNRPKMLGLNFSMDRRLFEALNGFDERFQDYGFEDSDLRDRAMRHRPRPRVKVLYGDTDVFHLWHPTTPGARERSRGIYALDRPVRCAHGLVRAGQSVGAVPDGAD